MFGLSGHESFILGVASLWLVSAAVGALNVPTTSSSNFYQWFYKFSKTVVGDLGSVFSNYLPKLPTIIQSDTVTLTAGDLSKSTTTSTTKIP
jgi:hypothetical protein